MPAPVAKFPFFVLPHAHLPDPSKGFLHPFLPVYLPYCGATNFCVARAPARTMVSSDDDRDAGLKFGFRAQQRLRERERREKSKDERKKREREADEEREMVKDVARRIAEGDLRARVLAKVAEQLETDEVQARLTEQVDDAQAATRKVRG